MMLKTPIGVGWPFMPVEIGVAANKSVGVVDFQGLLSIEMAMTSGPCGLTDSFGASIFLA